MTYTVLAVSALIVASVALAESVTVGQTYAIVELDALHEIEARARQIDWQYELAAANIRWSANEGLHLPKATDDRTRQVVPTYTVEFDVRDSNGQLIYPQGFRFNPLDHLTLPYRLVIIDGEQLDWAKSQLKQTDMLILSQGDYAQASQFLERPTFLLDEKIKNRLQIEYAPSIIEQSGNALIINEYKIEPAP